MDEDQLRRALELYRVMFLARCVDQAEADLVDGGEGVFHVPCSGHEGTAILDWFLEPRDYLHLHYRDKALMLARGIPPLMFLNSVLCNGDSHSLGRQMSAHMSDPARNILSLVGPVGNQALQAVGVAVAIEGMAGRPIVVCSMGEGTSQQGEVLEAIAEAVRRELPVLFWVEDNRYAISTSTRGNTFYSLPDWLGEARRHNGLPLHFVDGRDVIACASALGTIVGGVRSKRRPAIVIFEVERLSDHTNADKEVVYRSSQERHFGRRRCDPIFLLGARLYAEGVAPETIEEIHQRARDEVRIAVDQARKAPAPEATAVARRPLTRELSDRSREYRGDDAPDRLTMLEAIREVLRHQLSRDPRVTLLGEDIEDPKGDVFGLTRGLSTDFPGRVINAPLSESTILGTSIGRALAGQRPVAFLQFADFLPLAYNQIATELGSMYWRTNGGWECPVIVMAACGAYRPGLGPFHAHTFESICTHVPGVDVFLVSTAGDAAGLLNAAFQSGRPTIFLYPKICLNDRDSTTSADVAFQRVPIGSARLARRGDRLTMVSWGSAVSFCEKAADALGAAGHPCDLIDPRSLSPWDSTLVIESARRSGKLLIAHEDNQTCGFGAEVAATVAESLTTPILIRRVTRPDTYVPCNFANQLELLPSFRRILGVAAEMLGLDLTWDRPDEAGVHLIEAAGSSPADQVVTVLSWNIKEGETLSPGDLLGEMEADKAVFTLRNAVSGVVERIIVPPGEAVRVGTPLVRLKTNASSIRKVVSREDPGRPILKTRGESTASAPRLDRAEAVVSNVAGLSAPVVIEGSIRVSNEEIVRRFEGRSAEDIVRRTGIESRPRMGPEQSVLTMAVEAARGVLDREGLTIGDIVAVICHTTTPPRVTPSLACLVWHELTGGRDTPGVPAWDLNAACSGYLYALRDGFDFLRSRPEGRILILTAEGLSDLVDPDDFDTAILFGDAASASILSGISHMNSAPMRIQRPVVSGRGEDGSALGVPLKGAGFIQMDGKKVFRTAVQAMTSALRVACDEAGLAVADLDLVIPHQANGRIIEAVRHAIDFPSDRVVNAVARSGNTSSTSIPLALAGLPRPFTPGRWGLCAFGGGFTSAAAVVEVFSRSPERDETRP